jgi:hypothetical protein
VVLVFTILWIACKNEVETTFLCNPFVQTTAYWEISKTKILCSLVSCYSKHAQSILTVRIYITNNTMGGAKIPVSWEHIYWHFVVEYSYCYLLRSNVSILIVKHFSSIGVRGHFNPLHYACVGVNFWRLKYVIKKAEILWVSWVQMHSIKHRNKKIYVYWLRLAVRMVTYVPLFA